MNEQETKIQRGSASAPTDFLSYCEGDIEPTLNKRIHTLIDTTNDYIVYLDDDFYVEWSLTNKYEKKLPSGFGAVANRLSHLEALSRTPLRREQIEAFANLLGEAMARIVGDRDEQKAQEILDRAESYLLARAGENARSWYLGGSALAALPTLILAGILWLMKSSVTPVLRLDGFEVLIGALLGGTGALFSVLSRSERIQMDPTAGPFIHYVESISRIVAGNIGALVIALAVKANILLGFTKSTDYSLALLLVMCVCAGASERLVSGFISRVEGSVTSTAKG